MSETEIFPHFMVLPTLYRGVFYRSRTEARWAVFFDALNMRHFYEPEGFALPHGPYLPDFLLPDVGVDGVGARLTEEERRRWLLPNDGMWFEVKGQDPTPSEQALMADLTHVTNRNGLIAAGPANESTELWYRQPEGGYGSLGQGEFAPLPRGMTVQRAFDQAMNCRFGQ
jgi:hypothetical protein